MRTQWGERAECGSPRPWPGEQFGSIAVSVSDGSGTAYRFASAQAGGMGTEWVMQWLFRPTPPVTAGT